MKNFILTFAILFMGISLFAQTNMIIRKTDSSTIIVPISEIDSIYYEIDLPNCGTVTDYDGNEYQTVIIGTQCWMAENLKVTHYPNGDSIPLVTDNTSWSNLADNNTADAICFYNNNTNNEINIYGALYTYAAAIGDDWQRDNSSTNGEGGQGVCPDGWHLPTDTEFTILTNYLGMNAGSKLAGNEPLWQDGNLDQFADFGTSGFIALPGGIRSNGSGTFYYLGNNGNWWSATEYSNNTAIQIIINYNSTSTNSYYNEKSIGYSVRCIRD